MEYKDETIEVSIICTTYNHGKYVADALESFLAQQTEFAYEIIVHDDCSTDNTISVLEQYQREYPNKIKVIFEEQNQYSQGKNYFREIAVPKAKGKYLAICEGDDYWIDKDKLQKQYDILEQFPEINMCACGAVVVDAESKKILYYNTPKEQDGILTVEDVIVGGGRYLATASLFVRMSTYLEYREFERVAEFDYSWQIKGALDKGIYYINRCMAAYRIAAENSYTQKMEQDESFRNLHLQYEVKMLETLDRETQFKYHDAIQKRLNSYNQASADNIKEILQHIANIEKQVYVWGLGTVGKNFLRLLKEATVDLAGVCDIKNNCIGEMVCERYLICDTEDVIKNADIIIATNSYAYRDIRNDSRYTGELISIV